jgi:tight adherence protein B
VLSAEGRMSAWILTILPFILGGVLAIVNCEFISTLWKDELGLKMIWFVAVLMVVGIFWMCRLIKIRV